MRLIINLFIECLATEIVGAYKHLAGITEKPEKQCLQKCFIFVTYIFLQ